MASGYTKRDVEDSFENSAFTAEDDRMNPNPGSWSLGTGVSYDTGGELAFSNEVDGGILHDVIIQNQGPNDLYYGINHETISSVSGFPLASGISVTLEGPITKLWFAASSGDVVAIAQGTKVFNTQVM